MSDQWEDPICTDGDLDVAAASGLPVFSSPISASTKQYVFSQEWMCSLKAFSVTPLNTPHPSQSQVPDYSAYRLVEEGPRADVGGGMVKWTRVYAIVPDSHDEFESYSYQFVGFESFTGIFVGRDRFSRIVVSRVTHDYYLVGSGGSYASAGEIPLLNATRYVANNYGGFGATDIGFISQFVFPGAPEGTAPTLDTYLHWASLARDGGWAVAAVSLPDVDNPLGAGGQLIAETSRLSRWRGNIYLRQTRYILAQ